MKAYARIAEWFANQSIQEESRSAGKKNLPHKHIET
ncbi:MAG: hypothetical protein JWN76_292 [Chitinophagaceae bacterium]|nr:hypothetical protein [Chitinophagaceae bacterium]